MPHKKERKKLKDNVGDDKEKSSDSKKEDKDGKTSALAGKGAAEDYQGGKISPDTSPFFARIANTTGYYDNSSAPALYSGPGGMELPEIKRLYTGEEVDETKETIEERRNISQNGIPYENTPPARLVRSMFTDMLTHDHVGRMIRAFPTFVCQIIDEGKWFGSYRMMDNFYGTNALISMDVYKSRKIVADTAQVSISNVYGGLTAKRKDMYPEDLKMPSFFSSVFFKNYVFGQPTDEIFDARKELFHSIFLQTGARLHLRMGYGADAIALPIVFNGTITELNYGEVMELTAQGDGVELANIISGAEDDTNKSLFKIQEPSDYIGKLLTSKGSWLRDMINRKSDNKYLKENPLGIVHFGAENKSPDGTVNPFSSEYGEPVQNIYSTNGKGMKDQWTKADGDKVGMFDWITSFTPFMDNDNEWNSDYDEDNILVKLYGKSIWDIITTFTYCTPDYVASVVPFEYRSTLYFGKPQWPMVYRYDSYFDSDIDEYQNGEKTSWERYIKDPDKYKKSFMQAHVFNSKNNVVANQIVTSEDNVFPNVIVTYDGKVAPTVQADNDIRLDKQKTTTVEADIVARWGSKSGSPLDWFGANYWTAEAQVQHFGHSTVRDYMKDMYKGSYIVVGDSTVKPHDLCYLSDEQSDMHGLHLVKAAHLSMSMEDGFTTTIEPDAYVVNWDMEQFYLADKIFSIGKNLSTEIAVKYTYSQVSGKGGAFGLAVSSAGALAGPSTGILMGKIADKISDSSAGKLVGKAKGYSTRYGKKLNNWVADKYVKATREGLDALVGKDTFEGIETTQGMIDKLETMSVDIKDAKKTKRAAKISNNLSFHLDGAKKEAFASAKESLKEAKNIRNAKTLISSSEKIGSLTKNSKKVFSIAKSMVTSSMFLSIAGTATFEILSNGLAEAWARKKQNLQCVQIMPLKYKGEKLIAGLNGSRGAVVGDDPSVMDRWMRLRFGENLDEDERSFWDIIPKVMNLGNEEDEK